MKYREYSLYCFKLGPIGQAIDEKHTRRDLEVQINLNYFI